jgi:hypothetical protein
MELKDMAHAAIINLSSYPLNRQWSMAMSSNSEQIVQHIRQEFQSLLDYVTTPEDRTAYVTELTLFRRLLALGAALLRLFFLTRAAVRPAAPLMPDGVPLPYHDQRPISYYSVFGKLAFPRHYFYQADLGGQCPLDAALSLPKRCYSDLLRDWLGYETTDSAYRESSSSVARILGLDLSVAALEAVVRDDACDVAAFYDQDAAPVAPTALGTILVAQADGKGVPMVQPPVTTAPVRLGKGQKRTKKKEASVTSLYTIAPYVRTPQEVLAALLHQSDPTSAARRPRPVQKELRASLDGKEAAISKLAQRGALREGPHIMDRVALTDGAEPLQQQMLTHLPEYVLVLDIMHAAEYLWDTANALLGETAPERTPWIKQQLEQVLTGQTSAVIARLDQIASEPGRTAAQVQAVQKTAGYYRRNLPYMRYDVYLARGWPIGTGVVEGACGHLVKDRMEQGGMRWTKDGAQAILDLRAVRLTNDWEAYWQFHRHKQHERLYGTSVPAPASIEAQVLQLAA